MPADATSADAAYCAALARSDDRDRYLAAQFAPPPERARLLALLAVNAEIARIPRNVREPLLAEMRLKWWQDAIVAALAGQPSPRQPALAAFARAAAGAGLVAEPFERLIVARARDFGVNPLRDAADAEIHAEALSGALAQGALALLGVTDETAKRATRAVGIAYALVGLVGADGIPVRDMIREHIAKSRMDAASIPRAALPVLLWATAAEIRARRLARGRPPFSPWLPLRLAWRARRGRY